MTVFRSPYGAVNAIFSGIKGSVALSVAVAAVCDDPTVCNGMSVTVVDTVADGMSENIDEVDEEYICRRCGLCIVVATPHGTSNPENMI